MKTKYWSLILICCLLLGITIQNGFGEGEFVGPDWLPKAKGSVDANGLHDPVVELKGFPLDAMGNINWVQGLNDGLFSPRAFLGPVEDFAAPDFNIVRIVPIATMPDVVYPHKPHVQIFHCNNCHPKIFVMKAGANPINMYKIAQGEYCGQCHGKVAFPITNCFRCHSKPKDPSYKGPAAYIDLPPDQRITQSAKP